MSDGAMPKCPSKGCEREVGSEGDYVCAVCMVELEVLMKNEMAKRLGRPPMQAEFDILLSRAAGASLGERP